MHGKLVQKIHRKLSLHAEILPPLQDGNLFTKTSSHKNELSALFGDPNPIQTELIVAIHINKNITKVCFSS